MDHDVVMSFQLAIVFYKTETHQPYLRYNTLTTHTKTALVEIFILPQ